MASIEVDDLTKQYDGTRGIEGLTFSVDSGEVFGLVGPDGAGKTTTVRTLMGLQSPTSGRASVLGHDVESRRERTEMKQDVGYLPSDPAFDETLTGKQLLEHHASLKGDERSETLLERFELESQLDRSLSTYTADQKRLLATVIAFMHDPELAVVDEPTAGVGSSTRARLRSFFHSERERETTLFVASRMLNILSDLCHRIGVLRNGHLVDLFESDRVPDHGGVAVRFVTPDPVDGDALASDHTFGVEIERSGRDDDDRTTVRFLYTGSHETLLQHLRSYTIHELTIENAPIEELLTQWYGARLRGGEDV